MTEELTPRRKRMTSLALAGAVFLGGAAGATATMVGAGAQDDTTTTEVPAEEGASPERGERLTEALAPLVEDGTITQAQSDAVRDQLLESMPERGHKGHRGQNLDAIAEALGLDADALRTQLQDGSSLADVAEAQGVDVQAIIDIMVSDLETHLDEAVTDERLTQEEADEKLADATERFTDRVNGELPERGDGFGRRGPRGGQPPAGDDAPADAEVEVEADGASLS